MPGDSLQPDVSRLVVPRRSQLPDSAFESPSSRLDPTPRTRSAPDEYSWWGGAGDSDGPPASHPDNTPSPERQLDWPPKPLEAVTAAPAADDALVDLETAPCPCGQGLTVGGRSWCLKCGYDSDVDLLRKADVRAALALPAAQRKRSWAKVWRAVPAFAVTGVGVTAVIVATAYRREIVPDRTELRVWWTGIEAIAGLVLYLVGHVTAVVLTVRYWTDPQPSALDPWGVWKYAVAYLPRTRWAFALGLWGATAFGCAFALFWMNDYAFKDKTAKAPLRHIDVPGRPGKAGKAGEDKEDGPAVINLGSKDAGKPAGAGGPAKDPSGPAAAPTAPNLAIERNNAATVVVVGYVPDPADPSRVSRVALGTREPNGTIRFAGYADVDPTGGDAGLGRLADAKKLVIRPDYVPDKGVVPVEPTLTADIRYVERDTDGVFRNSLLKAVGEKKQP